MLYKLYVTHNKLSRTYGTIYPYTTDEMASKYIALSIKQAGRDLSEFDLLCSATLNEETGEIKPIPSYIVQLPDPDVRSTPISNPDSDKSDVLVK